MLEKALQLGQAACAKAEGDDKENLEQEAAFLQEDFDQFTDLTSQVKSSLEVNYNINFSSSILCLSITYELNNL